MSGYKTASQPTVYLNMLSDYLTMEGLSNTEILLRGSGKYPDSHRKVN